MASLTWLHLSDWHQRGRDFDRKVVRDALLRDLRERSAIDPRLDDVAFAVMSGDLAQGGRDTEYTAAREHLLDPVLRATGVAPGRVIIVPGNHDLDRDAIELVPAALTKPLASSDDANKWLTDAKRRSRALEPFSAFRAFVAAFTGHASADYANLVRFDAGGRSIAILGLNSAWMCGRNKTASGEVDDRGNIVLGEPQIHDALEAMSDADLRMVVLHHPWDWLVEWDQEQVEDRIHRATHFVLVGHVHRPKVKIMAGTGGDCVEIPAGASYDRRVASNPRYANAYNWVHLDFDTGEGTVFLRRWSEAQSAWIEDVDAYKGGSYRFQLPAGLAAPRPVVASPEGRIQAEAHRRADAEKRYRKLLLESCDIVDLATLPEKDRHIAQRQLELRRLYVPLRVWVEAEPGEEGGDDVWESLERRRSSREQGPRKRARVPAGERLTAARRLIVLGDPGAGKTTLTRWIATAYLLRLTGDPDWKAVPDVATLPDEDWLPIVIRCRDLSPECIGGHLDDMLGHTLRKAELGESAAAALTDLLRERLHEGKALLLLDGLDEINEPTARARFCEQIEQIALAYPNAPIIATSRIVGYREMGRRLGRGFEHLTLADLDGDEKDDFARRWSGLTELPERRESAAAELIRDIHSSDRIERMTGNPMLLTTFALVKRKVGKLPSRRADLYHEAVDVLLHWRPEVDGVMEPREAIPQLEYLAYAMCDRGVQRLRRDEVLELFERMRAEYPNLHAVKARSPEEFLRRVEARTGLLMESGRVRHLGGEEPVYEFRHLTFQEYLAARALVDRRFPGRDAGKSLAEHVAPLAGRTEEQRYGGTGSGDVGVVEAWREALRLCVTICSDDDVDAVLRAIVEPMAGEEASVARARAALGLLCLADEPNAGAEVVEQALGLFVKVVDERDGGGELNSVADACVTELAATRWADMFHKQSARAFCHRDPVARGSIGGLLGMAVWGSREHERRDVSDWLSEQTERLRSGDELEAVAAALGLMQAEYSGFKTVSPESIQALLDRLSGSGPMAHAAAWAMGWMNHEARGQDRWKPTPDQTRSLVAFISKHDADPEAVRFLSGIVGREKVGDAREPLIAWLENGSSKLRASVVGALGKIGGDSVVQPLILRLEDPQENVRSTAARALGELGSAAAVRPLILRLEDPTEDVRSTAARALGRLSSDAAVQALIQWLEHPDEDMRYVVAQALGTSGSDAAVQALIQRLEQPDEDMRYAIAQALGTSGSDAAVQPLIQRLEDSNTRVRYAVAKALGKLGSDAAVQPLVQRLEDPDADVRCAALGALSKRSSQDAILMSEDLDGFDPFLDPQDPITEDHASRAAAALDLTPEETRARYEALADLYHLKLAWRRPAVEP